MILRNVDRLTIERAAALVGVRVQYLVPKGRGWRLKLTRDPLDPRRTSARKGDGRYQRWGFSWNARGERRRCGALCWHGFRDFFRALFVVAPNAKIRTGRAHYDGADHFHARFPETGDANIGSAYDPICYADACGCESDESERARLTGKLAPLWH